MINKFMVMYELNFIDITAKTHDYSVSYSQLIRSIEMS